MIIICGKMKLIGDRHGPAASGFHPQMHGEPCPEPDFGELSRAVEWLSNQRCMMAICKDCGAPIEYRPTLTGRWMPVDPGRIAILTTKGLVRHGWVTHFCTCPRMNHMPDEITVTQKRFVPI